MRGAGLAGHPPRTTDPDPWTPLKTAWLCLTLAPLGVTGYFLFRAERFPEPPFVHLLKGTFDGCFVDVDGTTDVLLSAAKVETVATPQKFTDAWCRAQVDRAQAQGLGQPREGEVAATGPVAVMDRPAVCVSGGQCSRCGCAEDSPCGAIEGAPSKVWCQRALDPAPSLTWDTHEAEPSTGCYTAKPGRIAVSIDGAKVAEVSEPDGGVTSEWCRAQVARARDSLDVARWADEPAPSGRILKQEMINSPGGRQVAGDSP